MIALQLDGKVAVVTGGGRGLGAAAAWALAEAGADIALLARSEDQIVTTAREIEDATGRKVLACACDVTDEASVDEAASLTVATFGRVDVLVNNAGIAPTAPLLDLTLAELRRVLDVNVVGRVPLRARVRRAHGGAAQGHGHQHGVGGRLGGEPDLTAYCASKHARDRAHQGARRRVGAARRDRQRDRARILSHRPQQARAR